MHGPARIGAACQEENSSDRERRQRMNRVNPKYILRNHLAETAIRLARGDHGARDFSEVARLLQLLRRPYDEQPQFEAYAALPPDWAGSLQQKLFVMIAVHGRDRWRRMGASIESAPAIDRREKMKLLFDLLPIFAFFIAFKLGKSFPAIAAAAGTSLFGPIAASTDLPDLVPIMLATVIAIAITLVQIGWLLARRAPIKPALWLSAVLIVVFGGLTIWLRSELFIKWKPTLLYWCFTLLLVGGRLIARRNLLGALLGDEVKLPERVWNRLLWALVDFFPGARQRQPVGRL